MNENVESLVLEQLRHLRGQNERILDAIRGLKTEMLAVRHRGRGLELQQDAHHEEIASMKNRLDRIEKRLELVD